MSRDVARAVGLPSPDAGKLEPENEDDGMYYILTKSCGLIISSLVGGDNEK